MSLFILQSTIERDVQRRIDCCGDLQRQADDAISNADAMAKSFGGTIMELGNEELLAKFVAWPLTLKV